LVEDYRGAKEFLAEKLELLDVGNSDGEVETALGVVREAREARFFVLWFCIFSIS
jgi:t-SNARE complex subunit (syntaxin)